VNVFFRYFASDQTGYLADVRYVDGLNVGNPSISSKRPKLSTKNGSKSYHMKRIRGSI
jgi:hypothetical protein